MKSVTVVLAAAAFMVSGASGIAQTTARTNQRPAVRGCSSGCATPRCCIQPQIVIARVCPTCSGSIASGWYRGWADAVRAVGESQRNFAAAEIDNETARRMDVDNWAYSIRTQRAIRDEAVARERAEHPRLCPEQHREITRQRDPKRLLASQLSPAGVIAWPAILETSEFCSARSHLDELFAERAHGLTPSASAENVRRIDEYARELQSTLANCGGATPVLEQVSARNFVNSLRFEARQPLVDTVAAR
jgi:hypothetical protein